jgi:hypothetical protein
VSYVLRLVQVLKSTAHLLPKGPKVSGGELGQREELIESGGAELSYNIPLLRQEWQVGGQ